ncbi:GNAT family N-acetyltransferase [Blastochloris sulfoviridis]|uniref:N-acetyltransferase family protein n=1 Tax=Blastochloris sulfoviridis TaxID=50712 RepID=A0A5M6HZ27_9HYPH|nr:GNAT family N-acetyltransferase [Blastochloris sulfoviridis]KAA5601173.1 N-acetyltransferase family protein [Blastochloris sulfoviridis]
MSIAFEIRPAAADDFAAIAAIYAEAVRAGTASFELDPPDVAEMARRFEAVTAFGGPYLVAMGADGVLGYAYAGAYRTRPAYRFTVEDSIYLDARARGRGLGRALLGRLIATCTERGFRQMVAVIGDQANAASIGLHAALGFRMVGSLVSTGWKHGRWLDTVLMQRPLGPGDGVPPPGR